MEAREVAWRTRFRAPLGPIGLRAPLSCRPAADERPEGAGAESLRAVWQVGIFHDPSILVCCLFFWRMVKGLASRAFAVWSFNKAAQLGKEGGGEVRA